MAKKKAKKVTVQIEEPQQKGMLEKIGITDSEALAAQITRDFGFSEQTKYQWIPERNQDVKDYFGVIKNSEWPFKGASQIKSQFQRIVVDTLSGNILKSLFSPENVLKVRPSNSDSIQNAKYVEDLHNALLRDEYKLSTVLDKAVPTSLIESFCVLHPVYEYIINDIIVSVTRWVPQDIKVEDLTYDLDTDTVSTKDGQFVPSISLDRDDVTEDEAKTTGMVEVQFDVTKENCIKDGVSVKVINGYRFYMPLGTPGETPSEKVQRAPFIIHELFYTLKEVMNYSESGYFEGLYAVIQGVDKEHSEKNGEKPIITASSYDRQRELISYTKLMEAGFLLDTARLENEYVQVLKWCGKWKIDGKLKELIVWIDKNTNTILRAEVNIFGVRPYFPLVPFPIDETPYGESLCKIIRPLVTEMNLLMRTITNIALMKAAPPKFYDPASGFNPSTIGAFGPNSWIPAREPSRNVLIPPQPEDPSVAFNMLQFIINIIERITGVNEVIQGQIADRANTTATEIQSATARSGVRFDAIYSRFKDQLNPMFSYIHQLTLRHMPLLKEVRIMGPAAGQGAGTLTTLHKDQLEGKFNFELTGNSVIAEQNLFQKAVALYNMLGQHPYLTYKPESVYYVLYNIVKSLNPIAQDKILPTPKEIAQLERDRQKVQQEQEQIAVKQAQEHMQSQGQAKAQEAQMQMMSQQQMMKQEAEKHQLEMAMRQQEFQQKMAHKDAEHKMKIKQMEEAKHAQKKESSKE